jgi:hypothetical protein
MTDFNTKVKDYLFSGKTLSSEAYSALFFTLLRAHNLREGRYALAYALLSFSNNILAGKSIPVMEGLVIPEWAVHEVIEVCATNPDLPIASQDLLVTTRIISGTVAGSTAVRIFTRKSLAYLSKNLGFARLPRNNKPPTKPIIHPIYKGAEDLQGLLWYGLLLPGPTSPHKYFEISCNKAMMTYNRALVKRRRNGHAVRRQPLVQSQPGLCTTAGEAVQGNLLQDDGRHSPQQSCVLGHSEELRNH